MCNDDSGSELKRFFFTTTFFIGSRKSAGGHFVGVRVCFFKQSSSHGVTFLISLRFPAEGSNLQFALVHSFPNFFHNHMKQFGVLYRVIY